MYIENNCQELVNNFSNSEAKKRNNSVAGKKLVNTESTKSNGVVVFNRAKRARQLASAKAPSELRVLLNLLSRDLIDCKNGEMNGMCDSSETAKVQAMITQAQQKMSEVSAEDETESDGSFYINMLM